MTFFWEKKPKQPVVKLGAPEFVKPTLTEQLKNPDTIKGYSAGDIVSVGPSFSITYAEWLAATAPLMTNTITYNHNFKWGPSTPTPTIEAVTASEWNDSPGQKAALLVRNGMSNVARRIGLEGRSVERINDAMGTEFADIKAAFCRAIEAAEREGI